MLDVFVPTARIASRTAGSNTRKARCIFLFRFRRTTNPPRLMSVPYPLVWVSHSSESEKFLTFPLSQTTMTTTRSFELPKGWKGERTPRPASVPSVSPRDHLSQHATEKEVPGLAEDSDVQRHSVSIFFQRARGIAPRYMSQSLPWTLTVCQSILLCGAISKTLGLGPMTTGFSRVGGAVFNVTIESIQDALVELADLPETKVALGVSIPCPSETNASWNELEAMFNAHFASIQLVYRRLKEEVLGSGTQATT